MKSRVAIVVGLALVSAILGCEIEVPLDNPPPPDASVNDVAAERDAAITGLDAPDSSLPLPDAAMIVDAGSGGM